MKLYVYDHCPYCVKARMILGYHNINFEMITLLNDDEKTPNDLIGQKMVPILSIDENTYMPESLDIIKYIDDQNGSNLIYDEDQNLNRWLAEAREYTYPLAMPRWVKMPLKEFATQAAIDYFTKKKEDYIGSFESHLKNSEALIKQAEAHLKKLEDLFISDGPYFMGEKLSINDFHLFATLRSLTCVKGLEFPNKVSSYLGEQSKLSKVDLYLDAAL